jgi:hypothetical protein
VAGFISEWWPTSNRNAGRLRVGMGGRLPSESAPSPGRNVNAGGIAVHGCDHRSVVQSINSLKKAKADQLFVILSGHGLYAISKSVFLPSDYGVDEITSNNFWLEEYLRYFMSWNFQRQYVIYNACKEPIATIGRVPPVMARGPEAHPDSYKRRCTGFPLNDLCEAIIRRGLIVPDHSHGASSETAFGF